MPRVKGFLAFLATEDIQLKLVLPEYSWKGLTAVWMWHFGTRISVGWAVQGKWLDLNILEGFSNQNDSAIPWSPVTVSTIERFFQNDHFTHPVLGNQTLK